MRFAYTLLSGAVPEGDYRTEIARRMWCAVVGRLEDDCALLDEVRAELDVTAKDGRPVVG